MAKSRLIIFLSFITITSIFYFLYSKNYNRSTNNLLTDNLPFESILEDVKISGIGKDNIKWHLTAKNISVNNNFSVIYLTKPKLNTVVKNNSIVNIQADHGVYHKNINKIELWNNVIGVYQDITLTSGQVTFFINSNIIKFFKKIKARKGQITVYGDEGTVNIEKKFFEIRNNVRVEIL